MVVITQEAMRNDIAKNDTTKQVINTLVDNIIKKKDIVLENAIIHALGLNYTFHEVTTRCKMVYLLNETEQLFIDDVLMVEFYKPDNKNEGSKWTSTITYREFYHE